MGPGVVKHAPCTPGEIRKRPRVGFSAVPLSAGGRFYCCSSVCMSCKRWLSAADAVVATGRCYGGQRHRRPQSTPGPFVHARVRRPAFFRQIRRTICQCAHFGASVMNWARLVCPVSPLSVARARSVQCASSPPRRSLFGADESSSNRRRSETVPSPAPSRLGHRPSPVTRPRDPVWSRRSELFFCASHRVPSPSPVGLVTGRVARRR